MRINVASYVAIATYLRASTIHVNVAKFDSYICVTYNESPENFPVHKMCHIIEALCSAAIRKSFPRLSLQNNVLASSFFKPSIQLNKNDLSPLVTALHSSSWVTTDISLHRSTISKHCNYSYIKLAI